MSRRVQKAKTRPWTSPFHAFLNILTRTKKTFFFLTATMRKTHLCLWVQFIDQQRACRPWASSPLTTKCEYNVSGSKCFSSEIQFAFGKCLRLNRHLSKLLIYWRFRTMALWVMRQLTGIRLKDVVVILDGIPRWDKVRITNRLIDNSPMHEQCTAVTGNMTHQSFEVRVSSHSFLSESLLALAFN